MTIDKTISSHFTLDRLADGVFAAIHRERGWAIANAGIIDLGDATIVFDTFLTPAAALDLRIAAETLTGRPVEQVINSHYHNDHLWGNQAFKPRAGIIATVETAQLLRTKGQEEYDWYRDHSHSRLLEWRGRLDGEEDPKEKAALHIWTDYYQALVQSMPTLHVYAPDILFPDRFELVGSRRTAELISFTNGHTGSDTIMYLPEDRIIFMSDLLFVHCHPYLADGDPEQLLSILSQIQRLDAEIFVPGHGPVGAIRDLSLTSVYVDECRRAAEALLAESTLPEASLGLSIPDDFRDWQLPVFYEMNVRALHEQMLKPHSPHQKR